MCHHNPAPRFPERYRLLATAQDEEDFFMAKVARSLAGQVVVITGGARGIGRATAAALITQGARVAIGDIDASLSERTAEELGSGTIGLPLDVTDSASFSEFLDQVESRLGPLDVLINNAGIMPVGPFVDETDATAARMIDINLHGVIFGSKLALARFLTRDRGHLVNIASSAGKAGIPGGATYCATKYGVVGLSEAIRAEVRRTGIDVSVVMPVGVNTELYSGLPPARGIKTAEPEDVADAIIEALQTGRFEVYVPKSMNVLFRMQALLPRKVTDAIARAFKSDQVLVSPDHGTRAAYERRMEATVEAAKVKLRPVTKDTPTPAPVAAVPADVPPALEDAAPEPAKQTV
jgi:NAD(P)-dependent dehydrogenase (short-subunit alcohol dehydrogenase family)